MTDERFNLMASTAMELAAEMEWSDFPLLPSDGPRESARWIMVEASGDPEFIRVVRAILGETFPKLEAVVDYLTEFEPAEIMAANIVQRRAGDGCRADWNSAGDGDEVQAMENAGQMERTSLIVEVFREHSPTAVAELTTFMENGIFRFGAGQPAKFRQ